MKQLWDTCVKDLDILRKRVPDSPIANCEKAIEDIKKLLATHDSQSCFGLAANQIGLNVRACILTIPPAYYDKTKHHNMTYEFHNPHIVEWAGKVINQEWCYSLDKDSSYIIQRYKEITIQDDKNGMTKLTGIPAYAAQHEINHLDGTVICDKGAPAADFMKTLAKGVPKNSPCSCGSGKKYKRCCGK